MERNPYRSMYQYCACCGKWTANYADGAGRCADGIYYRSDAWPVQLLIAKVVGCTLPLIAKRVGLDPAIMATPLISTLVDISTISVYFAIVSAVFQL